ncbi:MAG: peptidoglycan bridge formation glycyltransferase FemA/FemB family protein [Clostridia bacterium]|nr:peptidoglycan bridge formation glycyltransferase FemA/FemB family protein [Clostridia bacterium]
MEIRQLTTEEFDNFAKNYPYKNFYQTAEYGTLMDRHAFNDYYLGLIDDANNLVAATLILVNRVVMGYKWGYCPRGYLIDYKNEDLVRTFTQLLTDFLKKRNFMFIKIDPQIIYKSHENTGEVNALVDNEIIYNTLLNCGYQHNGFNLNFENLKPRWSAVLTCKPEDKIFNLFSKEIRNKIRKADNRGVEVIKGEPENIKEFYNLISYKNEKRKLNYYLDMFEIFGKSDMFDIFFARINTSKYIEKSKNLYEKEEIRNNELNEELEENLDSNNKNSIIKRKMNSDTLLNNYKQSVIKSAELFKNNPVGIVVAACAVVKYNGEIFFLIDGIDNNYRDYCPNHYMKYILMDMYHNQGYNRFNLNGISGDFTKGSKYYDLTRFKLGFGCHVEEYLGEFTLVINKSKTNNYNRINPIIEWLNTPVL